MVLTVATRVDGVLTDAAETPSQLGDADTVNGSAALPARLMVWPDGFEPPAGAAKVKLDGLGASIGLLETTNVTGNTCGALETPAPVTDKAA